MSQNSITKVSLFSEPNGYAQFIKDNQNIEIISVNTISQVGQGGTTHYKAEIIMLTFKVFV